jgi:hypothetical protein
MAASDPTKYDNPGIKNMDAPRRKAKMALKVTVETLSGPMPT